MKRIFALALILGGFTSVSAHADAVRHSQIKRTQSDIRNLPPLQPVQQGAYSGSPQPYVEKTVESLPQLGGAGTYLKKPSPVYEAPAEAGGDLRTQPDANTASQAAAPLKSVASLSPKTRAILNKVGSNIGSEKSVPKKIVMKAGAFAPKEVSSEDLEDTDLGTEFEDVLIEDEGIGFEVKVSDNPPEFDEHGSLKKANLALEVDQFEAAIVLYEEILNKKPSSRDAKFGLATAYQKIGRKNRAKELYRELLAKSPKYEPALNNLLALAANEAPERALEEFARIQQKNPDFAGVYAQKAKIYRADLQLDYAIENLRKALAIAPDNNVYRYDLAILEDENGNYGSAVSLYGELVDAVNSGQAIPADKELISERMNYIAALR